MHPYWAIVLLFIALHTWADTAEPYRFGADDILSVTVFNEPELSLKEVRVATSGMISFPLLGQIRVEGMTAAELERKLEERLADGLLKNPAVTVSVVEYRQFYVNGEVKKPGGYSFRDGLTVQKAIALAGGFSERASHEDITIIREQDPLRPAQATLTDPVRPGDIITVDESFF